MRQAPAVPGPRTVSLGWVGPRLYGFPVPPAGMARFDVTTAVSGGAR